MLATLVIGLREGLEASLIVGIIAAFLRRSGRPLRPIWIGVAIAVALSMAVGVALQLVSAALPQAQQEAMESIIGLLAVAIVTGMIGWMNLHARTMRTELEAQAASAVKDGTAWALVGMAFLAVLKEGFETSVFLLAAFQSSGNVLVSSAGAVIGIAIAVGIGIGIFRGGVHLNLGRFFTITGIFLVFIAAGLVLTALRTAHEAGWILIGQQTTVNLAWLAPSGTVQAALLTGVLGIPADPRLIEVLGWLAYLIPTLAYLLWPAKRRPGAKALPRLRFVIASGLAFAAAVLAVAVTMPGAYRPSGPATLTSASSTGTARLTSTGAGSAQTFTLATSIDGASKKQTFPAAKAESDIHDGIPARTWTTTVQTTPASEPTSLTLTQLVELSGGRLPIGMSASQDPGPFTAAWTTVGKTSLWITGTSVLDAQRSSTTIVTLSGGGLASARTISPNTGTASAAAATSWHVATAYRDAVAAGIDRATTAASELLLWKLWIPLVLAAAALVLSGYALKARLTFTRKSRPNTVTKETYA
jgi:high-affinity iron transporter